jgi:DNA-binding transcriptional ArsR family regulator
MFIYLHQLNMFFVMPKVKDLKIDQLERVASMLKAIAHPMRIAILNHLEDGKRMTVTEIHEKLKIEQSTTSHHLGILKDKGVLSSKRDGKNTYYFLRDENLSKIMDCINRCNS